jgi:hypothetical protein
MNFECLKIKSYGVAQPSFEVFSFDGLFITNVEMLMRGVCSSHA